MTEGEWRACDDPARLLAAVRGRASDRKLRLFAVACCQLVWDAISAGPYRKLLEVAEGLADGTVGRGVVEIVLKHAARERPPGMPASSAGIAIITTVDRSAVRSATEALTACVEVVTRRAVSAVRDAQPGNDPASVAASQAWEAVWERDRNQRFPGYWNVVRNEALEEAERAARVVADQAVVDRFRCVFGNPFRPVLCDPDWRTSTVLALAESIYGDRAWDRLPVLADALEDAGCTDPAVLAHCRGDDPHARGCWVVDLVLGRN